MSTQRAFRIEDRSQIGDARRAVQTLIVPLDFGAEAAGRAALVVTELATNLLKHAGRGLLVLRLLEDERACGLELLALDRGPGIENVSESMRDGYSTAGSLGAGLGALRRVSSALEIYSRPGRGTAVRVELWREPPVLRTGMQTLIGAVCLPKTGEEACGDDWQWCAQGSGETLLVVDGLGHGPAAASAARAATAVLRAQPGLAPVPLIEAMHRALLHTRGAAVGVARLDHERGLGAFAGLGNVAASVVTRESGRRQLPSYNGTVGHRLDVVREIEFPFPAGALLVLHSDGIGSRWDLVDYPGLAAMHPALVAGRLYCDFERDRDDATVVALRRDKS